MRAPFSRTKKHDNCFFPYCIKNWNSLADSVKLLPSVTRFKKHLDMFIRPEGKSFYGTRDKFGMKILTKISVEFSDLRDHRYNHNLNCQNPMCSCGLAKETSVHYFLYCSRYIAQRLHFLSKISEVIGSDVSVLPKEQLCHILMYGSNVFNSIWDK